MQNEVIAFVDKHSGQADHHLCLAALRLAIDDKGIAFLLAQVLNRTSYRSLDASNLFGRILQPLELTVVLVGSCSTFAESLDVKLSYHEFPRRHPRPNKL